LVPTYSVPAVYDLLVYQGDTFALHVTVTQAGSPLDLTGYQASSQIRASASSTDILATFAATIATTTLTLSLTAAQTAGLPAGSSVWDVHIVDPGGTVTTLLQGSVKVTAAVTR
jgi:hypothetical protein